MASVRGRLLLLPILLLFQVAYANRHLRGASGVGRNAVMHSQASIIHESIIRFFMDETDQHVQGALCTSGQASSSFQHCMSTHSSCVWRGVVTSKGSGHCYARVLGYWEPVSLMPGDIPALYLVGGQRDLSQPLQMQQELRANEPQGQQHAASLDPRHLHAQS
jgi:hypothetical protein